MVKHVNVHNKQAIAQGIRITDQFFTEGVEHGMKFS